MDVIESTQNPLVKLVRSLDKRKERRETGLFVAEGLLALTEARRAGGSHFLYEATVGAGLPIIQTVRGSGYRV